MSVREIMTLPQPVLRRKARKVGEYGAELQTLVDDMVETMRAAPGVGLAAPQVNVPLRVIVVEYSPEDDGPEDNSVADNSVADNGVEDKVPPPPKLYVVVNPEIARISKDTEVGTEGCLSIPGVAGDVERPLGVTVKGFNRHGQPVRIKASGWLGRIFQHEIDHLEGVLFVDRAEKVWKIEAGAEQVIAAD